MNAPATPASWLRTRLSLLKHIYYAIADAGLDDPIPSAIERRLLALEERVSQMQGTLPKPAREGHSDGQS